MFDDESAKHADVVLPAESYAEKEGTVTHPDGRLQRVRPTSPTRAQSRPVWQVLTELAGRARRRDRASAPPTRSSTLLAEEIPFYAGIDLRRDRRHRAPLAGARRRHPARPRTPADAERPRAVARRLPAREADDPRRTAR